MYLYARKSGGKATYNPLQSSQLTDFQQILVVKLAGIRMPNDYSNNECFFSSSVLSKKFWVAPSKAGTIYEINLASHISFCPIDVI